MAAETGTAGDWKGAEFRRTLLGIVRKRVPERDVEDIVQATLTEALSPSAPREDEALRRWLIGVARHKIADRHRRGRRETFDLPELRAEPPPHAENDLVRWAKRALPAEGDEPRRTLEWMMREGDGEKLESIAESEQIPAPRVRKRVSRLRRHLRSAWRREVALLAALGIVAVLVWLASRRGPEPIAPDRIRPIPATDVAPPAPERPAVDPAPSPSPSPSSAPPAAASTSATPMRRQPSTPSVPTAARGSGKTPRPSTPTASSL